MQSAEEDYVFDREELGHGGVGAEQGAEAPVAL